MNKIRFKNWSTLPCAIFSVCSPGNQYYVSKHQYSCQSTYMCKPPPPLISTRATKTELSSWIWAINLDDGTHHRTFHWTPTQLAIQLQRVILGKNFNAETSSWLICWLWELWGWMCLLLLIPERHAWHFSHRLRTTKEIVFVHPFLCKNKQGGVLEVWKVWAA